MKVLEFVAKEVISDKAPDFKFLIEKDFIKIK